MNWPQVKGFLGLAVRARQAVFGEDGCRKLIRAGGCALLVLDARASQAARDRYEGLCARAGVPLLRLSENQLFEATGRPGIAMALNRGSNADELLRLTAEDTAGQAPAETNQDIKAPIGGACVE